MNQTYRLVDQRRDRVRLEDSSFFEASQGALVGRRIGQGLPFVIPVLKRIFLTGDKVPRELAA
jgi:hypothetical protein